MSTLLSVKDLNVGFVEGKSRRVVLEDLSFDIQSGECVALVGPSGSGKTTLLNLLSGLLQPDTGSIVFNDGVSAIHLENSSEQARTVLRRSHVSTIFQFFNLIPTLTVAENILLPLELNGLPLNREQAFAPLIALNMIDRLGVYPEVLSGGEQQRIAIVRALVHQPRLVLADEPTGNLDSENTGHVVNLLWQRVRASNASLLIATHNPEVAARADRVISLA